MAKLPPSFAQNSAVQQMAAKQGEKTGKGAAACQFVCSGAILGVLIYFFYLYGYANPDLAVEGGDAVECWVGYVQVLGVTADTKSVAPSNANLASAENWGEKFTLWFIMGFWLYCVQAGMLLIRTIGVMIDNGGLANCGNGSQCCALIFAMVWVVLGCIWRWGDNGTLAACYDYNCNATQPGAERDLEGTGYMMKSGKFMNIYLIISLVYLAPCALCILCLCCCLCLAAVGAAKS